MKSNSDGVDTTDEQSSHELSREPSRGGSGMKCRKPFRPKARKITPARYRATVDTPFIRVLLRLTITIVDANYIDANTNDGVLV